MPECGSKNKSSRGSVTPRPAKFLTVLGPRPDKVSNSPNSANSSFDTKKTASKPEDAQRRQQQLEAPKPLRKELEKIDRQLQSLNSEKASLQTLLTTAKAPAEIAQTGKRLKAIDNDLDGMEERWLAVTEQIEQIETVAV